MPSPVKNINMESNFHKDGYVDENLSKHFSLQTPPQKPLTLFTYQQRQMIRTAVIKLSSTHLKLEELHAGKGETENTGSVSNQKSTTWIPDQRRQLYNGLLTRNL